MKSSIPLHWRLNSQRYRLVGSGCTTCGLVAFPPRESCPFCAENQLKLSLEHTMTTAGEAFIAELPRLVLEEPVV